MSILKDIIRFLEVFGRTDYNILALDALIRSFWYLCGITANSQHAQILLVKDLL